jgi:hypothetical protein
MNDLITTGEAEVVARVRGEPLVELPQDLYIPPEALEVFLETFEGPLDLLLYLIRKQNLDILDIPIAEVTRQYMAYIELMQNLKIELAAEYLVMAAMLAERPRKKATSRTHAPNSSGACRNTSATAKPPSGSTACRAWGARSISR